MTTAHLIDEQSLPTGDGHLLHVAQYGKADGLPAVVLHGGPGSGTQPSVLEWFDLSRQRVVLFDQRGAGRSQPHGSLINNDSPGLVADLELIRERLGIRQWMVVGGSWGATLALLYARLHAGRISAMVLRGSFLASDRELHWFFQSLRAMVPQGWAHMTAGWDETAREQVLRTLAASLLQGETAEATDAALRWGRYEAAVMQAMSGKLEAVTDGAKDTAKDTGAGAADAAAARQLNKYRLQAHYLTQGCFTSDSELTEATRALQGVPVTLVHGTHDLICPPENAMRLKQAMPHATLQWVANGGHTPADPAIAAALKSAIAALAAR